MSLTVDLVGDTQVVITRLFRARPEFVWRAHTDAVLIPKWCTGPDGWTMPVCQCDPRPGGSFRYEWTNGEMGFHATGEFISLTPHSRIEHVERMFLPDPTPENHVVTVFTPVEAGTRMVMTMSLPDASTREAMLATGMADGMEDSYARMEGLLAA
ncbi:SRPBCC domain-containing protein [Frigidibacter sp. SD6-1]|uniref:SRPBCC domain-containing protein n=1 Tax=Frigidibacter sp. SD6-1 TaxID=3032581 RepID=UPI0024DFCFCC|nr:SRPBCC domain-containing protein [Frigidibacter sp. SD6-1]